MIAALVAIITLVGSTGGGAAGRVVLPQGPAGSLLLAPAVLALGVITVGYPVAFALTAAVMFAAVVPAWRDRRASSYWGSIPTRR